MTDQSDETLLRRYADGDRGAFDVLFRRYAARMHATALRLTRNFEDAEDTLQEVFLSLACKVHSIRRGSALSAWLYRATVNRSMDALRKRRFTLSLDEPGEGAARVIAMESLRREALHREAQDQEARLAQIEALVPRLPERQAATFVLRHFQRLAHREIGAILGCSEAASKSHHSLACGKLRRWIAEERQRERQDRREARP